MKVLQFTSSSVDSEYMRNLGMGLAASGIELMCGTLFASGAEAPKWIGDAGAKYFCLNVKARAGFPLAVWKLAGVLRREKVDILQTHLYEASLAGMMAAKFARVPLKILTRHHTDQAHIIGRRLAIAADRWEAAEADRVVVLSKAVRDFMMSADHIAGDKIEVIYQGFDFEKFSADESDRKRIREEFRICEQDFVIGTFGNFFPTKGHRFLIAAAKELKAKVPGLKLLFVGAGGDVETLKQNVAEFGLRDDVIFTGFRTDVGACMKAVDAVVHPSLSEAFCQVLVEAMSVGTPLISTDVGGAREVIKDGETALLISAGNVEAIVDSVKRLYDNPEFSKAMAAAAQKSVRERFTIEKMVGRQIECYNEWLNIKNNGRRRAI